jgi:hypothetical protein
MSVGRNLQEMENVVTKGAAPAEPMHNTALGLLLVKLRVGKI